MPQLSDTMSRANNSLSGITSAAASACSIPQIAKVSLGVLKNNLARIREEKDIVASIKNSALSGAQVLAANIAGIVGEGLLDAANDIADDVGRMSARVEGVLSMIFNADTEFRLALAQLIVNRMNDRALVLENKILAVNSETNKILGLLNRLSQIIYQMGEGSIENIKNAKKAISDAEKSIEHAEIALDKNGVLSARDISSARSNIGYAAQRLSNKFLGSFSVSVSNGLGIAISPEVQQVLAGLEQSLSRLSKLLGYQEDLQLGHDSLRLYRSWILSIDDALDAVQAAAAAGLYKKNLQTTEQSLEKLLDDIQIFLDQQSFPVAHVQFRRQQFLLKLKEILAFIDLHFSGHRIRDNRISRLSAFNDLKRRLEGSELFSDAASKKINETCVNIIMLASSAGALLSFDQGKLDRYRAQIRQTTKNLNWLQSKLNQLRNDLSFYKGFYDQTLVEVMFLLESLGMVNVDEKLAAGEVLDFVNLGVDAAINIVSAANCIESQVKNINLFNPEDTRKAQTLIATEDAKESASIARSIESTLTPQQAMEDYAKRLEEQEKEMSEQIQSFEDELL